MERNSGNAHHINHVPVDDPAACVVGVVALGGIGLIHFLDLFSKWDETRYVAWLFIALLVGLVVASWLLLTGRHVAGWACAGGLAASTIGGYIVSRVWGLPNAGGDIGNWTEPLGAASLFVEAIAVTLSTTVLLAHHAARRQPASPTREVTTTPRSALTQPDGTSPVVVGAR